ncbi:MAG: hypothetical protein WA326_02775 [Nitrososphaeraceae archaeon]
MKNQIWYGFGGFAKYRSAVLLNRFVIYMTNIITPNMDKFVFIKMIMIVVVTSVGVLQHNINNTTAQEQPPATVKVAAGGGNATAPWTIFVPPKSRDKRWRKCNMV